MSTDKLGRVLVWLGNLMHGLGAEMLAQRNRQLESELRAALAELEREGAELEEIAQRVDAEHQGAEPLAVDEHQGDELAEERPEWLGFGGFPENQSGARL